MFSYLFIFIYEYSTYLFVYLFIQKTLRSTIINDSCFHVRCFMGSGYARKSSRLYQEPCPPPSTNMVFQRLTANGTEGSKKN